MDPHKPIYISSGTMRRICPRPTPSSTCLTLTPCHGRGDCRERSVTLPTKRCWRCWGRYISHRWGAGLLFSSRSSLFSSHSSLFSLLTLLAPHSSRSSFFSLLTLFAPHSSLLTPHSSLHHPLLLPSPYSSSRINVCITGVG